MSLDHLRSKLSRLDQLATRLGDNHINRLATAITTALVDSPAFLTTTTTFKSCLTLDLTYALARHRLWINNNLFITALVDFLSSEYRLAESSVRTLLIDLVAETVALLHQNAANGHQNLELAASEDRDFLRYIFVASATSNDEVALTNDLGLGTRLLGRVRQSVESAAEQGSASYLGPLDADVAAVMTELADDNRLTPWALDVQRLRFEVWEAGVALPTPAQAQQLFKVLLNVGRKRRVKEAKNQQNDEQSALRQAGLVFVVDGTLELAPKGQALTAAAFAAGIVAQEDLSFESLAQLNAHYQERVIATHPSLGSSRLVGLVKHLRPLAPLGLRAAITRLAADPSPEIHAAMFAALADAQLPPWLAAAADAAIRDVGMSPA